MLRACISAIIIAGFCVLLLNVRGVEVKNLVATALFYIMLVGLFRTTIPWTALPARLRLAPAARLFGKMLFCALLAAGYGIGVATLLDRLNQLKPVSVFFVLFVSSVLLFNYSVLIKLRDSRKQNKGK